MIMRYKEYSRVLAFEIINFTFSCICKNILKYRRPLR